MLKTRLSSLSKSLAFMALLIAAPVSGQDSYSFTASLLGSLGGSLDADPDAGLGNTGFQLNFAWVTDVNTHVVARAGELTFSDEQLDQLTDPELRYITLAGEYKFDEHYFRSGLFLGLGYYELEGLSGLTTVDDTAIGLTGGATGEFQITRRFSILLELSLHFADLEGPQLFAIGHGGLAFHF